MKQKISSCLREAVFIAIKPKTKKPLVSKKEDWNTHPLNYEQANSEFEKGNNVGLIAGEKDFIVFECDSFELSQAVEQLLPETYCEASISDYGGFTGRHYIFRIKGKYDNLEIKDKKHYGELRANRQYIVISPSVAVNKQGELKQYEVLSEVEEIPYVTKEQVKEVLKQFIIPKINVNGAKLSQELLERINKYPDLKQLFETEVEKGARSEKEQELVDKLVARDFSKEEIFSIMGGCKIGKWNEKPISYRQMTYNKAVQFVTNEKKEPFEEKVEPLEVMTIQDYEKYKPDKNYIIQNLLFPKESGMMYAPSNSFKSLIALHMACCIATGKKFLGKFNTKINPVLMLSAEDSIEIDKTRIKNILRGIKSRKKDIPLYILPRNKCEDVLNPTFQRKLNRFIKDKGIKVLFLDTINPLTPEIDDNKGKDVTRVFNEFIKPLCDEYNVLVIFLHHTTKKENSNSFLGSVKWKANCDNVWRIQREKLERRIKFYNEKSKNGETETLEIEIEFLDKEIKFRLLSSSSPEIYSKKNKLTQHEIFLMKLNELVADKKTDRKIIFATFDKHKLRYSRGTLDRAINEWRKNA